VKAFMIEISQSVDLRRAIHVLIIAVTAQEASWMRGFYPSTSLLFNLYH